MHRKKSLTLILAGILALMAVLIGYKVYLFVYEKDYAALNADHLDQIEARLAGTDAFSFAVVGNIQNAMRIFERRIAPMIQDTGADFIISAGNAVYDGSEDKYRLLYRGLKKNGLPYVLAAGHNELEDFGQGKFYQHFGPLFFSFHVAGAYFIFLDSTGKTSWAWQERWLKRELELAQDSPYRFVVLNHSLFPVSGFNPDDDIYVMDEGRGRWLQQLCSQHQVTAVFSAGYPGYQETRVDEVTYLVSGGGGGLLLGDKKEKYQFLYVRVTPSGVTYDNVEVPHEMGQLQYSLETVKLFLHSFFYMSLFNLLAALCAIGLVALKVYALIIRQEHLYRDFSIDEEALSKVPLRVAMFTNNYLPFIGGVPLSINRLYHELVRVGAMVKLFAPVYPQQWSDPADGSVVRCPVLFQAHTANFPIANIFSRTIDAAFNAYSCDVVHVHHPFWLGKKGLRLAKKRGIPVILTYHTRLERYTHYIPLPGTALKNLGAHFLIKHFANHCDAIITPTASTEEYLRHIGVSSLVETIPTGISFDEYERWSPEEVQSLRRRYAPNGERLLISVARLAKEKNLDFLIDGLAKVNDRTHTPFRCLLVGDGPERERLNVKVRERGMGDRIVFTGNMAPRDVIGHYLAADLFVFASTSETQGMVLLEAMGGGCPVVAVRASGVYDVVKDAYNGFQVSESTESWANAVAALLEDPEHLSLLSRNSRAFAEEYSEKKIVEKVLRLYRRVLVLNTSDS